jgi:iron complex transport system substrate-binding protein
LGKDAEAEELISSMKSSFEDIMARAAEKAGDKRATIYFEVSPLEYGLWTSGTGTFMDEIATMLGLENIFSDVSGWAKISQEQVIDRNPDFIVTSAMSYGVGLSPDEEIYTRAGWQEMTALVNNRVFMADSDSITRPGPRLVEAAETLYAQVYE